MEQRIQLAADVRLTEMEAKFESSMGRLRAEAQHQVEIIRLELEQLRRAASGDTCGWEECEDGTFANLETGEEGIKELPETLAFARAARRVDDLSLQEESAKKAQKRAQVAETKRRELDVRLNEARADAQAHRELISNWGVAARGVASSMSTYNCALDSVCNLMIAQSNRLSKHSTGLARSAPKIRRAIESFKVLRGALAAARAENNKLKVEVTQLDAVLVKTKNELTSLRSSLEKIAVIAARKALTFLEETASSFRGHAMAGRRPEDDTPAFVDVEALRGLR